MSELAHADADDSASATIPSSPPDVHALDALWRLADDPRQERDFVILVCHWADDHCLYIPAHQLGTHRLSDAFVANLWRDSMGNAVQRIDRGARRRVEVEIDRRWRGHEHVALWHPVAHIGLRLPGHRVCVVPSGYWRNQCNAARGHTGDHAARCKE